jgi:hypothetical protein
MQDSWCQAARIVVEEGSYRASPHLRRRVGRRCHRQHQAVVTSLHVKHPRVEVCESRPGTCRHSSRRETPTLERSNCGDISPFSFLTWPDWKPRGAQYGAHVRNRGRNAQNSRLFVGSKSVSTALLSCRHQTRWFSSLARQMYNGPTSVPAWRRTSSASCAWPLLLLV